MKADCKVIYNACEQQVVDILGKSGLEFCVGFKHSGMKNQERILNISGNSGIEIKPGPDMEVCSVNLDDAESGIRFNHANRVYAYFLTESDDYKGIKVVYDGDRI